MRHAGKIAVLTTCVTMAGCATHAVRCDERLQAINAPRPKPPKPIAEAPRADAVPAAAPAPSEP